MAKPTGVWGIDIGQCALKAIRLEMINGRPTATAFDYIEHQKILSQPDADPDALTREALEKFLSRNPIRADQIAISIAGQSGLARFVKLPPVEAKKILEIVRFEAKQQIPFPLEEVVWDYQKIAGGETIGGFAMETEIGLFAMKREIINRHLGHYQAVKADVHYVQMAPLALCNYATYEILKKGGPDAAAEGDVPDDTPRGKRRCVVILDIGTDSSNLIITDGGKIIWQRPVPLGGNNFTRALTKELKLTFAKAEHLKRNAAKSPDLAAILKGLRPVLTDFVGEVQRSLGYFTNTHRDAHVAYLVGLGSAFKLPGLQKYLSEKLSLEVKKPSKFERVDGDSVLSDPVFSENILTFPVAYGLALQGLTTLAGNDLARLQTNLLPDEIRIERVIRAKKPWAAAAAACMVLGVSAVAFGYGNQYSAVKDKQIETAIKAGDTIKGTAESQIKDQAAKKADVEKKIGEVKAIIEGNEDRFNWARVYEVISAAVPRPGQFDTKGAFVPGSTNLELPEQVIFWQNTDTKKNQKLAYQLHLARLANGVPIEKFLDEDLSEHLAMVNIEAIDTRFTDNLAGFLTNAQQYAKKESGLEIAEDLLPAGETVIYSYGNDLRAGTALPAGAREISKQPFPAEKEEADKKWTPKAPEGGGWVVEIRGYTYNNDATKFLKKCFVRNLQPDRLATFALATGAATPPAKPEDKLKTKVGSLIPGAEDPVLGRFSHVFLCISDAPDPKKATSTFRYIGNSKLDQLLGLGATAGGIPGEPGGSPGGSPAAPSPGGIPGVPGGPGVPGVPGGPGAPGAPGAGSTGKFKPLIRGSAGSGSTGASGSPGSGSPGAPSIGGVGGPGEGSPVGPAGPAVNVNGKISTKIPHEFIIYMIWREPNRLESSAAPKAAP